MTTSCLVSDLQTIAEETRKLNQTADRLTKSVQHLNEHLQKLEVGLTCYYTEKFHESPIESVTGKNGPSRYYIGYDRDQNGKWGICVLCKQKMFELDSILADVKAKHPDIVNQADSVRWVHSFETCPRNIRLSLVIHLPDMLSGLSSAVRNMSQQLDESLNQITGIEAQIKKATS